MATEPKRRTRQGIPALLLNGSTPTVFPGVINGVLEPGVPMALADLGLTRREAELLISDGLPLSLTRVGGDAQKED